jgi:GNAT superfamily N-acetyltransferase
LWTRRVLTIDCNARSVDITIRALRAEDGPSVQAIERLAGERFRDVGLDSVADDEPDTLETLARYADGGRGWVASDHAGGAVGYVLVDEIDGNAHIEQVSVRPDHQGAGVARALVERVRSWATETSRPAITLTTFAAVPWNGPLYVHLGFEVLAEDAIGPELRAVRAAETAHGLDPDTRICMRLNLGPSGPGDEEPAKAQ